jgi:Mg2+ and Co2+ transporter CorA
MTLVTGTFGMDITGIRSEATAPDAWWAFGAWAVVFAVTLGVIFVYVLVRKHTSKQVA